MKRFKKILIDVTAIPPEKVGMDRFIRLAKGNAAAIDLFSTIEETPLLSQLSNLWTGGHEDHRDNLKSETLNTREDCIAPYRREGIRLGAQAEWGRKGLATVKHAAAHGFDLVVIPKAENHNQDKVHAVKVMRKSPVPVWLGDGINALGRIGV